MGKQRTSLGKEFGSRRGEGGWGCVRGAQWEAWKVLLQTAGGRRVGAAERQQRKEAEAPALAHVRLLG